ncbi:MAG: transposase [Bacteroidales bacterium]|nr:transposase [Bacteroidales bacterium]
MDLESLKPLLYRKDWVVYAKKTFAGPAQILHYLGRYTHRVAISNSRILGYQNGWVTFRWKDYRNKACWKTMQLDNLEFMRRFLLHVLPCNFYKIRYYGIMVLAQRRQTLLQCRDLIRLQKQRSPDPEAGWERISETFTRKCPECQVGTLKFYKFLLPGAG